MKNIILPVHPHCKCLYSRPSRFKREGTEKLNNKFQHKKVTNLAFVEYSVRQFFKPGKKDDFCMFMQSEGGATRQAPKWSARDLSSGHEVRCPEVSPSPLKWSRADLSRGDGLKGGKKAIFPRFFRPENV